MEVDSGSRADRPVKAEDDAGDARMGGNKATYRSWKKKYRKMRNKFDLKMREGEMLHQREEKALATARRLAVAKDRLLEILLDNNNCPQIPPEKRFDLNLDPPSDEDAPCLDIDIPSQRPYPGTKPAKSYKQLLKEVPHHSYAAAGRHFPGLLADLDAGRDSPADPSQGIPHPPSFLTADDIDNYIWEIDNANAARKAARGGTPPPSLPTLAPLAHAHGGAASTGSANGARDGNGAPPPPTSRDFALRNPVSVYNWLRKHAPKTFLQDGETHPSAHADKENGDEHSHSANTGRGSGHAKADRAGRGARSTAGTTRSKRTSAAHSRDKSIAAADSMEYEDDYGYEPAATSTPSASGLNKGKRKRMTDDDAGYRPKGGSSRPTKKKRKSDGGEASTPTAGPKRPRKSGGDSVMKDD